ncbi:ATPase domain-containing protein [Paraburkholderia sp. SIMBA_009]|uniref:Circadian clock protein KaiC n=1 Tax=Paraburkholderia tropica TaxID=92647 RepID=A0AAQ1GN88_9BURK|nr:ATPase domain-containing protein [Paraburkholderia tropica]RQN36231.1 serine/threonine protein kinase [Paraburkholderia tropica]SEK14075.1 circadian clock protein KaiC [Paraburkholderia tropica]
MHKTLTRLNSHVPGLDAVLGGGLIAGSAYILQGRPGAGKTILANQIAFGQARQGAKVLYITLLAETHERLFQSLSTLEFYESDFVGRDVTYLSLFRTLRVDGLGALVEMLRKEIARQGTTMLILDGLLNARESAPTSLDVKTFVAELQGHASFSGCTVLFLTSARIDESSPEHTMVDGVIQLEECLSGSRTVRQLRVSKSRGSAALGGLHHYLIDGTGIAVYPRFESLYARPLGRDHAPRERVSSGVDELDQQISGGLPACSATAVIGTGGSGKTSFGLNFLRLATAETPALHFGFYESPARLASKARALGVDMERMVADGAVDVIWNPLTENVIDKLGYQLLDAVQARNVQRVVVDGLAGFDRASADRHRFTEFLAALTNQLRVMGVTLVCTWETTGSGPLDMQATEALSLFDNVIGMELEETDGRLYQGMKVLKIRDSAFKPAVTKLIIPDSVSGPA